MKHLKEEFDKLTLKEVLAYALGYLSMIAGFVLLYLAMYIDPEGEIHPSVLSAFGMVCVMSSGLLGYTMHIENNFTKFKASINEKLSGITGRKEDEA